MGISTPKKPFDLAAFLSQPASPESRRFLAARSRGRTPPADKPEAPAEDQAAPAKPS